MKLKNISTLKEELSKFMMSLRRKSSVDATRPRYVNLTPIDNADSNGVYTHALKTALKDPNVLNIAITGPYGSGKSSVLKTFSKHYMREYRALNISLATFEKDNGPEETAIDAKKKDQEIERSILQQMLYGNDSKKLKYSRFKRIVTPRWSLIASFTFVLSVLSIWWVLEHVKGITYKTFLFLNHLWLPFSYLFCYTIMIGGYIYRQLFKLNISTVSLKNGEIQLGRQPDSSILNRHLDEILYFFERTKYKVVIFEDLDRFDSPNIFIKLREINNLINRGKKSKKRVRFIYAVKDGLFGSQTRTKFFDFIIPIVPVVDCNNAGEKMKDRLSDTKFNEAVPTQFLREVSVFLTDLRLIHNIFNEFNIYCEKVKNDNVDATKLIALLIYKNVFPNDFEDLHFQNGVFYDLCAKHRDIRNATIEKMDAEIAQIRQQIKDSEQEEIGSVEELRFLFTNVLSAYIHERNLNWSISSIHTGSKNFNFSDLSNHGVLEEISSIKISTVSISHINQRTQNKQLDKSIDDIYASMFGSKPFLNRVTATSNKKRSRRLELQKSIQDLEGKKVEIRNGPFSQSISQNLEVLEDANDTFKEDFGLFRYLVLNGYLDEKYGMYTSLFYEGSLTKDDMDFLRLIYAHNIPDAHYHLTYVDEIIARMGEEDFSAPYALNITLINHLLASKDPLDIQRFKSFLTYTQHSYKEASDFIHTYLQEGEYIDAFVQKFSQNWSACIKDLIKNNLAENEYICLLALRALQYVPSSHIANEMNQEHEFSSYVAEHLADVCAASPEGISTFESLIKLNPRIIDLPSVSEQQALVSECIDHSLYQFNTDNMVFIAQVFSGDERGENTDTKTKNISVIRASKNSNVIENIDSFLSDYLEQVAFKLPDNSNEELATLIYVANHEEISDEYKKEFLKRQLCKIPDVSDFPENLWEHLLELNMLIHTWRNVSLCLNSDSVSQASLAAYVSQHSVIKDLLATGIPTKHLEQDDFEYLEEFIVLHVGPDGDAYQQLLGIVDGKYDSVPGADVKRKESLLKADILSFSPDNIASINGEPKLYAQLIANNFDDFAKQPIESVPNTDVFAVLLTYRFPDVQTQLVLDKLPDSIMTEGALVTKSMASAVATMKDLSSVSDNHLLLSISNLSSVSEKLELFSRAFDRFDEATVMHLWTGFPEPYCNIGAYGNKPRIPKTQTIESLLQRMVEFGMISSVKDEKDELRVHTFKSSDH